MLVIAHRGASRRFPENSLLAFEQAILQAADGIELDVHFHPQSQQYIVLHDAYLEKTTNGIGHYTSHSIEQLTKLSLGQGQQLITLPEALKLINGRVFVNIELKTAEFSKSKLSDQLNILREILDHALTHYQFKMAQFAISSFNHVALYQCKQQLAEFSRAALISHFPHNLSMLIEPLEIRSLNVDVNCFNSKLVENCHQLALKIWVFTVDRVEDISSCYYSGVDGIFTNSPQQTLKTLSTLSPKTTK